MLYRHPRLAACMIAIIACLSMSPPSPSAGQQAAPASVPQYLQDISVTVRSNSSMGSGVLKTTKDGTTWVLTCGHVVVANRQTREAVVNGTNRTIVEFDDLTIVTVRTKDGRKVSETYLDAEVIRYSDAEHGHDLALLRIRDADFKPKSSAVFWLDKGIPGIGSDLYHCGSLLGLGGHNSLTGGILSQHGRILFGKTFDQSTCTAFPGCLPADTMIELADGSFRRIVDIREGEEVISYDSMISMADGTYQRTIQEGDQVLSFHTRTGKRDSKTGGNSLRPVTRGKVTRMIESGIKPLYEIRTWNRSLKASGNHPLVVVQSVEAIDGKKYFIATWKRADEIKAGDIIGTMRSHTPFRKSDGINFNHTFGQGRDWPAMMRLLGFYIGDGYSRERKGMGGEAAFYTFNDDHYKLYSDILRKEFRVNPRPATTPSGIYISVSNVEFVRKLESLGICGRAKTKRIPDWVYQSPPDLQRSFLEGLIDADGHRRTNGNWNLELANENLIKDTWMLCNHLGIHTSNIANRQRKATFDDGREVCSETWTIEIYPFTKDKNKIMNGTLTLLPEELRFERVASVVPAGEEMTYDLTVARYSNFFANGVLVHNSSGGPVVLKADGRYVGMVVRGAGEGFNLLVPVRRIQEWAGKVGIGFILDDAKTVPSEEELSRTPIEDREVSVK